MFEDKQVLDPVRNKMVNACRECGQPRRGRFHWYCCQAHKEKWEKEHIPIGWAEMRARILRRDNHTCSECRRTEAQLRREMEDKIAQYKWRLQYLYQLEVDHILPVRTHPELEYEESNLRTLCHQCHAAHGARPQTPQTASDPSAVPLENA